MRLRTVPRPGEDARTVREALAGPARLAARTRAMLAGALSAPDLEDPTMPNDVPTSLRLPAELLSRAEALVARVTAASGLVVTRSQVVRLALERGLAALEAEYPPARPARGRTGR